ncbi:MAG: 4-hydroxy-tetrahydrodipicolinate reductase [Endomicrobia bacterium]|nr:4-hydroxy-tetrahydrodipicolinate reductase [Endomicrobiia bacterium]
MNGALGRMGKTILSLAIQDKNLEITGLADIAGPTKINDELPKVEKTLDKYISNIDVVIDFSSPEGTQYAVSICKQNKVPIVIGTTGHSQEQLNKFQEAAKYIPLLFSPNMSLGVNILYKLVEMVTKVVKDKNYDIELIETHHNKKKDAPSGTAKKIMEIIKEIKPETDFVFGRNGLIGERKPNEVGVNVLRCGDVIGEHNVIFCTYGERIELKHTASSREIFAKGAIIAANWIFGKPAGFYTMLDVLGL